MPRPFPRPRERQVRVAGHDRPESGWPKNFGFQLSIRHNDGKLDRVLEFGDAGSVNPLTAGFHDPEVSEVLEGGIQEPAVGYYVGPTTQITGTVDGKTVVAKRERWSHNPKITVFWFDNTIVTGKNVLTSVSAYNAAGAQVATATVTNNGL